MAIKNSSHTPHGYSIFGEPQRATKKADEKCVNNNDNSNEILNNSEEMITVPIRLLERWVQVGLEHRNLETENDELRSTMFKLRAVLLGLTD